MCDLSRVMLRGWSDESPCVWSTSVLCRGGIWVLCCGFGLGLLWLVAAGLDRNTLQINRSVLEKPLFTLCWLPVRVSTRSQTTDTECTAKCPNTSPSGVFGENLDYLLFKRHPRGRSCCHALLRASAQAWIVVFSPPVQWEESGSKYQRWNDETPPYLTFRADKPSCGQPQQCCWGHFGAGGRGKGGMVCK